MDYNWWLKQAEHTGIAPKLQKGTMPQKGGQTSTYTLENKMATGTTYGGRGALMDVNAACVVAKCFRCGKLRHFKCNCPNQPKSREEAMQHLNYYWDKHPTEEKILSTIEEVKDGAKE